jgi:hypothetical protein
MMETRAGGLSIAYQLISDTPLPRDNNSGNNSCSVSQLL